MARTATGSALTEAHRQAQVTLSAAVIRDLAIAWRLLDPSRLDSSFREFLQIAATIIASGHTRSAGAALAYLDAFRRVEGASGPPPTLTLPPGLPLEQIATSLLVVGPIAFKTALRSGKPPNEALQLALSQTLGAGTRLALAGGRETITTAHTVDTSLVAYARVTDGNPCAFCAMLASRGAVYVTETSAGFQPHDACHCQPEPVYDNGNGAYQNPGRADEYRAFYNDVTSGKSGADAISAFRAAWRRR